jgi:hypothetical protein
MKYFFLFLQLWCMGMTMTQCHFVFRKTQKHKYISYLMVSSISANTLFLQAFNFFEHKQFQFVF